MSQQESDAQAEDYSEEPEDGEEYEEEEGGDAEQDAENFAADAAAVSAGIYNATDVNDQVFEELHLAENVVKEVQSVWAAFLRTGATRDAAGEALYSAVFEAAPSLQSLFKTPRAVMAMRFINGLSQIVNAAHDPPQMKTIVETLGFQHLDLEVTAPRTAIFRDAIAGLLNQELNSMISTAGYGGLCTLLNYVGGAYIYIRMKFTERLKILNSSWATANNKKLDADGQELSTLEMSNEKEDGYEGKHEKRGQKANNAKGAKAEKDQNGSGEQDKGNFRSTNVPTTFNEMFMFNAAVMGFGDRAWMHEVIMSFNDIVRNVSNCGRLQEECDVLGLRLAKHRGTIVLSEYRAVMLASLRSLVPKDWNTAHEGAWSWLWDNVEHMIKANLGKPAQQERALGTLLKGLDEKTRGQIRRDVYSTFFTLAPAGQDYFKQSTTRLHFIADRIVAMTLEIYKDPTKMVEDISALGLRHVGYGIPTELFGPFVTACVQVVRGFTDDVLAEEAFRWSLSLVARILTRVINEGSTIVMKAINTNAASSVRKAVACAPRGKRAIWMLNIQVGTQCISPLIWAIETGSLEAAKAMIMDLLTIRADRDHYYYGMDDMFERHPDIVRQLVLAAPALLPTLFDGLIWRSRTTENGMRRVNYYIKHLLVDSKGGFAKNIEWLTENQDPKIVCHPVVAMVTDVVWSRVAYRVFLIAKAWVILTLTIFICGVAVFNADSGSEPERIVIAVARLLTYLFSLAPRVYFHVKHSIRDFRKGDTVRPFHVPVPAYLVGWQDLVDLLLTVVLFLMMCLDPVIHCLGESTGDYPGAGLFTQGCAASAELRFAYSVFSAVAVMMFFLLIIDLNVFSTRVSAFVLICFRVMSEVWLYIIAVIAVTLTFSCSAAALRHELADFDSIPQAALSFMEIAISLYDSSQTVMLHEEPALFVVVVMYVVISIVFLLNLLIAQINCAYQIVFEDMVGYARLNRGKVVTEAMPSVSAKYWGRFVGSLRLDEACEFGEGDVGLSGAIQVLEPASQHITTVDMIRRFGGSTSPAAQWPQEDGEGNTEQDRMAKLEYQIEKLLKRTQAGTIKRRGGNSSSGVAASSLEQSSHSSGAHSEQA